ncbi:MAG: SNF2-related protein [bacterium]
MAWRSRKAKKGIAPDCGDLACSLYDSFPADVRVRGMETYREGLVLDVGWDDKRLISEIGGHWSNDIKLLQDGTNLSVSCTCPFFDSKGLCKHIWAAVLAAGPDALQNLTGLQKGGEIVDLQKSTVLGRFVSKAADNVLRRRILDEWHKSGSQGSGGSQAGSKSTDGPIVFRQTRGQYRIETPSPRPPPKPTWQNLLAAIVPPPAPVSRVPQPKRMPTQELWHYTIDIPACLHAGGGMRIRILRQIMRKSGMLSKPKNVNILNEPFDKTPESERDLVVWLKASSVQTGGYYYGDTVCLSGDIAKRLLPQLCATGRFRVATDDNSLEGPILQMDVNPEPWVFGMELKSKGKKAGYELQGCIQRGQEVVTLESPLLLLADGWIIWPDHISRLEHHGNFSWIILLRRHKRIDVPAADGETFLETMLNRHNVPTIALPAELKCEFVRCQPSNRLHITASADASSALLMAKLGFDYQGLEIWDGPLEDSTFKRDARKYYHRDLPAEDAARNRLQELGFKLIPWDSTYGIEARKLAVAVSALTGEGWEVKARGKVFRKPGEFSFDVSSGVDWFDLNAKCDFEGVAMGLPELLKAVKDGQAYVTLKDGSLGVLPSEWIAKYAPMISMGEVHNNAIRFRRSQALIIDALLAAQPAATCDEVFRKVREGLGSFDGIRPGTEPDGFIGQLRPYQKFGLGWFRFLQAFSFGGCLADDMGLGKTVQVLALLQERAGTKGNSEGRRASLVVAPRSLIFNWMREAERFAPSLTLIDHTGIERCCDSDKWSKHNLVLTTYGTLQRDIDKLKDYEFDYVILDEAQAIKNSTTQRAKVVRLLNGRHRLALSGTPIENHLGELWSLFEFLNPGMLGHASIFLGTGAKLRNPDPSTLSLLTRALKPFILRRTKREVAPDLPEKTEKTLMCELQGNQKKLYDELRDFYRQSLLGKVDKIGMAKSKIMVLEALLRLRQAACHPGLIDKSRSDEGSAKLETLMAQLQEIVEEGHKALVFSQFVSFLTILKPQLDKVGISYEYLDGKTSDRESIVQRFQTDASCKLFLISLKAGGLGLNLTAAEYVFLLDPWWNPAVEAQAIDRTHRIGQTEKVFAYRLIAKDTVEERMLELQKSKRDLADAVINANGSVLSNLTREDLEMLLG